MAFVRHVAIAFSYAVLSAGVALLLPRFVPEVDPHLALVLGGVAFIAAALLHEVFARQEESGRLADEVHEIRQHQTMIMRELAQARDEVARIHGAIAELVGRRPSKDWEKDLDTVVAEVRVLQTLVEEMSAAEARRDDRQQVGGQQMGGRPALSVAVGGAARPNGGRPSGPAALPPTSAAIIPAPIVPAAPREMPRDLDDDTVLGIMREGLRADRVDLFVQPVVSLPQRKRRFFEAFTRIRTEDGAVVVPEQYIALAEREGLVPAIDNLLLFRCVQLLRKTQRKSDGLGFFCNISPHTIADRTFFRDFVDFMGENAQLAPRLFFELPQSTLIGADADLAQALKRLGAAGFRFSMDQVSHLDLDFAALGERHVRFLKVDAALILAALADPAKAAAARDLKKRVARFGIDLIVAKIETESMLRDLLDLEIDYGQGYLFGEPRPGAEVPL